MADNNVVATKKSWKTWTAGIGTIVLGVGQIAVAVATSPFSIESVGAGCMIVLSGLAILGLGDKIQKLTTVLKEVLKN